MRILVLGAGGMAGHVVTYYLRENGFDVDSLSAKSSLDDDTHILDVTDKVRFIEFLDAQKYDVVINCIGLLVKQSDERKDQAVYINSYLPRFLEQYYKDSPTKVIHISTDAVFSGQKQPYREDSAYDGETFYGRTKALGEIINDKDLTFRTSIIGPAITKDGTGLFNWFYGQKGEVQGFTTAIWNGVTTVELAESMAAAIKQNLTGLYHLAPKDSISKFDLLKLFKETFDLKDVKVKPAEGAAVNMTLKNTRTDFKHKVPDYKTMVDNMKTWIKSHPELYGHYE